VQEVYNEYAFKLGFGIHIRSTKYNQAWGATKDDVLSWVFECLHAGKPANEAIKKFRKQAIWLYRARYEQFQHTKIKKGKQVVEHMDGKDTRRRNKVLRHDCKRTW
jgi:hypothetical protein